jgi:hypothetical protein
MSKRIALIAVLCFALSAVPAFGAKGTGGGNTATIAFAGAGAAPVAAPASGSQVSFAVTANVKPTDVYNLWVSNVCSQNGVVVSAEYHPVQNWVAGSFTTGGSQCTAMVTLFPDVWTALKGGSMTYSVAG